jgi:hypothetical protein
MDISEIGEIPPDVLEAVITNLLTVILNNTKDTPVFINHITNLYITVHRHSPIGYCKYTHLAIRAQALVSGKKKYTLITNYTMV